METVNSSPRRDFLLRIGGAAGAAWLAAQWPAMLAAAQHAHAAANANSAPAFEVLTPEQAKEIEAISSLIIPTDELPGAREAGVVYFIDRALKTFAADAKPLYERGSCRSQSHGQRDVSRRRAFFRRHARPARKTLRKVGGGVADRACAQAAGDSLRLA